MAGWDEILREIGAAPSQFDSLRRRYLEELSCYTGRNTILYYSAWLNKRNVQNLDINDLDTEGFMNAVKGLECSKGLDLILHTPGGDPAAAEQIISYLKEKFDRNIRVIVPQLAMSAGTMMACAAKIIFMGRQSSLGPIDPQFNGIPAFNILQEFEDAKQDLLVNKDNAHYWAIKLQQYPAAFMKTALDSIKLSEELIINWLCDNMFKDDKECDTKIDRICKALNNHEDSKTHSRHFNHVYCSNIGLKVELIENDSKFQDLVLSVHHATMITLDSTAAVKIIENNMGKAYISQNQLPR